MVERVIAAGLDGVEYGKTAAGHLASLQDSHEATLAAMGEELRKSDPTAADPAFVIYDFRHHADFPVMPTSHAGPAQEAFEGS